MKKLFLILIFAFSIFNGAKLYAHTDCNNVKIVSVFADSEDNYFYINLNGGGLNGKLSMNSPGVKFSYAAALSAVLTGKSAWVRYEANNVNCSNPAWNEVVQGVGIYHL